MWHTKLAMYTSAASTTCVTYHIISLSDNITTTTVVAVGLLLLNYYWHLADRRRSILPINNSVAAVSKFLCGILRDKLESTYSRSNSCVSSFILIVIVVVVTANTTYGDRCFAAAGPRLWNSLPAKLRQCDSLGQFKQRLKTYLFGIWDHGALWLLVRQRRIEIPLLTYLLTYLLLITVASSCCSWCEPAPTFVVLQSIWSNDGQCVWVRLWLQMDLWDLWNDKVWKDHSQLSALHHRTHIIRWPLLPGHIGFSHILLSMFSEYRAYVLLRDTFYKSKDMKTLLYVSMQQNTGIWKRQYSCLYCLYLNQDSCTL